MPLSLPPHRGSRSPYVARFERCYKRDWLLHVRYRDGARVIRYPYLSMFDAFKTFGKQKRPFALASRPKSYLSRPPPYPLLWFGLRAYDTCRENASCSPCSFLVLRRQGTAGQLCWCRCRPAGVTAETTAVDQRLLQAYRPARGRRAVRWCASVIPVSRCTGEALCGGRCTTCLCCSPFFYCRDLAFCPTCTIWF